MPTPPSRSARPKPPSLGTLRRYGLTPGEWVAICERQSWLCPVCRSPLGCRPLAVDHVHVKGFKARKWVRNRTTGKRTRVRTMPQEERKRHVRGVLHNFCNRYVRAWLTLDRARAILEYLEQHATRAGHDDRTERPGSGPAGGFPSDWQGGVT